MQNSENKKKIRSEIEQIHPTEFLKNYRDLLVELEKTKKKLKEQNEKKKIMEEVIQT